MIQKIYVKVRLSKKGAGGKLKEKTIRFNKWIYWR